MIAQNNVIQPCSGNQSSNTVLIADSCTQGNPVMNVSDLFCSAINPQATQYQSPAGEFPTPRNISGGVEYDQCAAGSTIKTFSRRVCNSGYSDSGSACVSN